MKVRDILPILTIAIMLVATDCSTRSDESASNHSALLTFLDAGGNKVPVTSKAEWD